MIDSSGEPSEPLWRVLCSVPYQIKVSYSVLYQKVFIKKDKQFWAAEVLLQRTTCALCRGRPKLVNWSKVEDTRPSPLCYFVHFWINFCRFFIFLNLYIFRNFAQSFAWRFCFFLDFVRIFFPEMNARMSSNVLRCWKMVLSAYCLLCWHCCLHYLLTSGQYY